MSFVIASRYARALADVVRSGGDYVSVLAELEDFQDVCRESAELREIFESPVVSPADKRKVLDAILVRLGTSEVGSNFLRVLLVHYRMNLLDAVIQAYRKVVNERLGIVEVKITYARDLLPDEQQALRDRFAELTQRKVEVDFQRDEQLLGGVLAQIGSVVYDGSVKGYLERLRERLTTY